MSEIRPKQNVVDKDYLLYWLELIGDIIEVILALLILLMIMIVNICVNLVFFMFRMWWKLTVEKKTNLWPQWIDWGS